MDTPQHLQRRLNDSRRRAFAHSVKMLQAMGFAPWAIQYFVEMARVLRCLPHEVVVKAVQHGAWSQLDELSKEDNATDWTKALSLN